MINDPWSNPGLVHLQADSISESVIEDRLFLKGSIIFEHASPMYCHTVYVSKRAVVRMREKPG